MNLQGLRAMVRSGEIDTVIVAFPDVFGRLVGKRFTAEYFIDHVARHGTHGCNYLLTVDIDMEPLTGFQVANWEKGFGDFALRPDPTTLRPIPWLAATALVICDFAHEDGTPVAEAPRSVLRRQVQSLATRKFTCNIASELEFFLFNQSFADAFAADYRNLKPSSDYRIDYHTMQTARDETLFRAIRNGMQAAGVPVESSKGEWGRGQHEVNFTYGEPIEMADRHIIFKQGVKEIAAQSQRAVTFMAKPSMTEPGNSCHIHCSLWNGARNAFWDTAKKSGSRLFRQFLGGLLKYSRELSCLFAPTVNAYKRYQAASWAPTKMAWAYDNRTVGFRVVGHGDGFRIENRMPGADANPYLAFAATLAAGMAGIDEQLDCGDVYKGNAYVDASLPSLPSSLAEAADLLDRSKLARRAFGDAVIDFYVHTARLEVQAFQNSVTDWEKHRYFERI
ncbi:MAG: glutamine synthetase family protein [Verrucomicrobia subdivision 3 bacterium]|nr:glutamine synthetase family protein [Limisphaerales bacterium]